jgi:amidase
VRRLLTIATAVVALTAGAGATAAPRPPSAAYRVAEKSIGDLRADLAAGRVTSVQLVQAYLRRIDRLDRHGPSLHSIIALNPDALAEARACDAERRKGHLRGPLHGIPIVVKDNIETADPVATTAGSLALAANVTHRDAPLVARLRAAGAVILAKANLSEWANMRSALPISGWSAMGGLTRNPYATDRSAEGSSAGPAAATAASLAAAAVGTETDGSIVNPASVNGLVGLKPTVGLIPRTHIVPITHVQDTAGPMARSVADAALLLSVMAGPDPDDPASQLAPAMKPDYLAALNPAALKGARLGLMRFRQAYDPKVEALLHAAEDVLRAQGAEVVEVQVTASPAELGRNEFIATLSEMKADLNAYLATTPATVRTRTLADVIAFNAAHAGQEMPFYRQERFEQAQAAKPPDDPDVKAARLTATRLAGPEGLAKLAAENHLDALIAPTTGPTWGVDLLAPDRGSGPATSQMPALAGWPHLTVPMGEVLGLPVGLSFIGPPWSEARLLGFGYAYEQHSHARRPPTYVRFEDLPQVAPGVAPANRASR